MVEESFSAEEWDRQGDTLLSVGDVAGAIVAYAHAVESAPGNAGYLHDLGRALLRGHRHAEAEERLAQAHALSPEIWEILCDLGTSRLEQGKVSGALDAFSQALVLKPDAAPAAFNKGNALYGISDYDAAEHEFRRAVDADGNFVPALMSLAVLLGDIGKPQEAAEFFARALKLTPNDAVLQQSYALQKLKYGELREGFAAYAARFLPSTFGYTPRPFPYPRWNGEPLHGKSMLLWTEQGLGDEILAASMFHQVLADTAFCAIECSPRVAPLFQRSFPSAKIIPRNDPPAAAAGPWFDYQAAGFSLGKFVRQDFTAFPAHEGYLRADPALIERLRRRYRALAPGTKVVGISWESAARHGQRKRIPIETWGPVLNVPGVTFVSLQYGASAQDCPAGLHFDAEVDALKDIDASAAQVAAMDLVITVSNTTAHLAGAQNIPVWTLIPSGPGAFWYWFRNRQDSPWYPSMRLFRQNRPGDWASLLKEVGSALVESGASGRL